MQNQIYNDNNQDIQMTCFTHFTLCIIKFIVPNISNFKNLTIRKL